MPSYINTSGSTQVFKLPGYPDVWPAGEARDVPVYLIDDFARMADVFQPAGGLSAQEVLGVRTSGAVARAVSSALSWAYQAAKANNIRVNDAWTTTATAFGGTPTSGTVGYDANGTDIVTTNYTAYAIYSASSVAPFRMFGASPYWGGTAVQGLSYNYASGGRSNVTVCRLAVITDAPEPVFTVPLSAAGATRVVKVRVDNKRCSDVSVTDASSGGYKKFTINLRGLTAGPHLIEFLIAADDNIGHLYIPKAYSAWAPPARPVIAAFTDSLGNTVPDATGAESFISVLSDVLGAEIRLFGAGGTGYLNPGSYETFRARVPLAATRLTNDGVKPILIINAGGVNDYGYAGYTGAALQAEVQALNALQTATFGCPILNLGSWASNNSGSQNACIALEAYIKAASTASGAYFLPTMTDSVGAWISGTGNSSATTSDGTSDYLFGSSDGTHWIKQGHLRMGLRVAQRLADILSL